MAGESATVQHQNDGAAHAHNHDEGDVDDDDDTPIVFRTPSISKQHESAAGGQS